jgi:hypothetical protein
VTNCAGALRLLIPAKSAIIKRPPCWPTPIALDLSFTFPRPFLLQLDPRHMLATAGHLKGLLLDRRADFSNDHLRSGPGPIDVMRMARSNKFPRRKTV